QEEKANGLDAVAQKRIEYYENSYRFSNAVECAAIPADQVDEGQVSNLNAASGASATSSQEREAEVIRTLVSTTCIECVIKSRMTGDCHVRFCEQPRGETPLG
ncbi:hypothetical protein, partial [Pectobacterium cacticida]|uniref:hypothetical protein n=1 Tax=Pectobacterium cacticida TaxID=69221 RepID=UPI00398600B9